MTDASVPMRYDIGVDEMVPVTQEWISEVQKLLLAFGLARQTARTLVDALEQPPAVGKKLHDFLDAWKPEFEQKG